MKNLNENTKQNILALTISGIIIVTIWFIFSQWSFLAQFFGKIWDALTPFIWGFMVTFIVLPLRNMIEKKWLSKYTWSDKVKRRVAVICSMIIFSLVIITVVVLMIPQLSASSATLISNLDGYLTTAQEFASSIYEDSSYNYIFEAIYENMRSMINNFISGTAGLVSRIVGYSVSFAKGIFDFLVGMIISIYLLIDSEKFLRQVKRIVYALFSESFADKLAEVGHLTAKMLNNYVFGKALDSFIVGVFCYLATELMHIPYAPLISFVVMVTNMIPVFGPFIGAVPSIFILLIIEPKMALEFAILILVIQQIDGNILGPYILGDSMGLPPIWIMFAIIVGGAIFGVVGMFMSVPLFSVIYVLITRVVRRRLKEKDITIQ